MPCSNWTGCEQAPCIANALCHALTGLRCPSGMDCATNFAVGGTYAGYCNLACGFCECRNLYDVAQQSPGACDTLLDSGAYSCADTFAPGMVFGFNGGTNQEGYCDVAVCSRASRSSTPSVCAISWVSWVLLCPTVWLLHLRRRCQRSRGHCRHDARSLPNCD
jgi:hypothetical protein